MQAVVTLHVQYRMAEDIQSLANRLVYSGQLQCATWEQAAAMLRLPGLSAAPASPRPPWLEQVSSIIWYTLSNPAGQLLHGG